MIAAAAAHHGLKALGECSAEAAGDARALADALSRGLAGLPRSSPECARQCRARRAEVLEGIAQVQRILGETGQAIEEEEEQQGYVPYSEHALRAYAARLGGAADTVRGIAQGVEAIKSYDPCAGGACAGGACASGARAGEEQEYGAISACLGHCGEQCARLMGRLAALESLNAEAEALRGPLWAPGADAGECRAPLPDSGGEEAGWASPPAALDPAGEAVVSRAISACLGQANEECVRLFVQLAAHESVGREWAALLGGAPGKPGAEAGRRRGPQLDLRRGEATDRRCNEAEVDCRPAALDSVGEAIVSGAISPFLGQGSKEGARVMARLAVQDSPIVQAAALQLALPGMLGDDAYDVHASPAERRRSRQEAASEPSAMDFLNNLFVGVGVASKALQSPASRGSAWQASGAHGYA